MATPAAQIAIAEAQLRLDKTARQFRTRIGWVLGAGVALLIVLVAVSLYLFERNRDYSRWVDHTYEAEAKINALGSLLERGETARRGYLLDPREAYWANYVESRFATPGLVDDLARFTSDNPDQVRNVAELRAALKQKYAQFAESIELAHKGHFEEGRENFLQQQELVVTQQLRAILENMRRQEANLLVQRERRESGNSFGLFGASVSAAVLLAVLAFGSALLVRRYSNDLAASETALRRVNEGLEEAVKARTTELTRANEEIQRFAYIVSHDLRSPLVNVMGFTAELETAIKPLTALIAKADAADPDLVSKEARAAVELDLPESVGFIRTSTQKMDRLINAILRLSREGRRTLAPEPLDMDAVVGGVIDNLRVLADRKEAEVRAEGPLPPIESDRVAVEQVLANLVENAIKYSKPGRPGRIVVRGHPVDDRVVYEVADNGRGIAAADQQRVFDLFRRAGAQDQPGEGIGLAHVRALVYRLGGLIDCTSELDQGTVFRVHLPSRAPRDISKAA